MYVCLTMKYSDWQFITMMKMISKLVSSLQQKQLFLIDLKRKRN